MKIFTIIFVVGFAAAVSALTPEQVAKGEEFAKACVAETGVAPADVQKMKAGDFTNKDEKLQCFANCVLEKAGFMKDGVLQESYVTERLSTNVDKEKVAKVVAACKGSTGANKCEISFNAMKCYAENKASLA